MYYNICPYQIVSDEIWYQNPDGLTPEDILARVIEEDYQRQAQKLLFTDATRSRVYSHRHVMSPENGVAVIELANRYVEADDATFWRRIPSDHHLFCATVIVSRQDGTSMVIEENEAAFGCAEDVANILCRGLNTLLIAKKIKMVKTGPTIRQRDEYALASACAVIGKKVEELLTATGVRPDIAQKRIDERAIMAVQLFRCTPIDKRKAPVIISLLYEITKEGRNAKELVLALRAAMDAGVIEKPSYKDFVSVFNCSHLLSKSQYSEYTNPKYLGYESMKIYKTAIKQFEHIRDMII